jgi:DNA-binding transcriptional LysR family regulator
MTIQSLRYLLKVAEKSSITEAAKSLFISQPSLSTAIKEIEKEIGFTIFTRSRTGIALTKEGIEFLGYARQVTEQMELLESRFISNIPPKQRFCISTQHYTFTANAFVEMVNRFGQDRFEFILNETQTFQIIEDVKNRFSDLGILFISNSNETILRKLFNDMGLVFYELFTAKPHVFLKMNHPLANKKSVLLDDLKPFPRLSFLQGNYGSEYYAEELFSMEPAEKSIKVSDRAAIVNLMIGLDGYTISSGIYPKYLHGDSIISIPLDENERMQIGYILNEGQSLSELGKIYIDALLKYD